MILERSMGASFFVTLIDNQTQNPKADTYMLHESIIAHNFIRFLWLMGEDQTGIGNRFNKRNDVIYLLFSAFLIKMQRFVSAGNIKKPQSRLTFSAKISSGMSLNRFSPSKPWGDVMDSD